MRALDAGEDFVVTRNGKPVGELRPCKRRQFDQDPAGDELPRARRQLTLQHVEAKFESLPKPGGGRAVDVMIAATALAHDLPLYTRNPKDLRGLEELIEIVDVSN